MLLTFLSKFQNINFYIFCSNKAFSKLFSKKHLKDPKVLGFLQNRGKFENRHFCLPPQLESDKNDACSFLLVNAITPSNVLLTYHSTFF